MQDFIQGKTMAGSGILNIQTWRDRLLNDQPMDGITPLDVAASLKQDAQQTFQSLSRLPSRSRDRELRSTLADYEAMADLGNYYAEKILGAADLAIYEKTGASERQASAVRHLTLALEHWKKYARLVSAHYRPQLLTRIGLVDLNQLTAKVSLDVKLAAEWKIHSGTDPISQNPDLRHDSVGGPLTPVARVAAVNLHRDVKNR